jgi:hypothetical protein
VVSTHSNTYARSERGGPSGRRHRGHPCCGLGQRGARKRATFGSRRRCSTGDIQLQAGCAGKIIEQLERHGGGRAAVLNGGGKQSRAEVCEAIARVGDRAPQWGRRGLGMKPRSQAPSTARGGLIPQRSRTPRCGGFYARDRSGAARSPDQTAATLRALRTRGRPFTRCAATRAEEAGCRQFRSRRLLSAVAPSLGELTILLNFAWLS